MTDVKLSHDPVSRVTRGLQLRWRLGSPPPRIYADIKSFRWEDIKYKVNYKLWMMEESVESRPATDPWETERRTGSVVIRISWPPTINRWRQTGAVQTRPLTIRERHGNRPTGGPTVVGRRSPLALRARLTLSNLFTLPEHKSYPRTPMLFFKNIFSTPLFFTITRAFASMNCPSILIYIINRSVRLASVLFD